MPNGVEEQGGGQLELGLVATVVDEASRPARDVATGLQGMFDWFQRLAQQGKETVDDFIGTLRGDPTATTRTLARVDALRAKLKSLGESIQKAVTAPFRVAGDVISKFFNKFTFILGGLAAAVVGFFAFRNLKRQLDEIFESTVKLEEQFVKLANFTGSEQFARDIIGWAEEMALKVPIAVDKLRDIGSELAFIGIQVADINFEGLLAAAALEGRDPTSFIREFGQAIKEGRIVEMFANFRSLPLDLATAATQLGQFDFTGRAKALSESFATFAGPEAVDRIRRSVTGIRQLIANTFDILRQTILGKPGEGGLFDVLRERMQFFLDTLQRNRPLLMAVGQAIGNILATATRAFNRLLTGVLEKFGLRIADVGERVAVLQRNILEPLQVSFAAFAELIERVLTGSSGFVDFITEKFKDFQPILQLLGAGLLAFGIITGNVFLVAAGVGIFIAGTPGLQEKIGGILASAKEEGIEGITSKLRLVAASAALALIGFGVLTGNLLFIGAGILLGGVTVAQALAFSEDAEPGGVVFQEGQEAQRLGVSVADLREQDVPTTAEFLAATAFLRDPAFQQPPINITIQVDATADPQKVADTTVALLETMGSLPGVALGTDLIPTPTLP